MGPTPSSLSNHDHDQINYKRVYRTATATPGLLSILTERGTQFMRESVSYSLAI